MQNLTEFLKPYPEIELAELSHNDEMLQFLDEIPMELGSMALRYSRAPDFFALLRQQGSSWAVFLFRNHDGSLGGLAVISIRESWQNGEASKLAYCSDLRVSKSLSRKTQMQWWKCYADLLGHYQHITEFAGVKTFHTAILDANKAAVRAFTKSKRDIVYRPLRKYKTVSLVGQCLCGKLGLRCSTKYSITKPTESDISPLAKILVSSNKLKVGGYYFTDDLSGIDFQKFRIVKNNMGKMVACVSLNTTSESRRVLLEKAPFYMRLIGLVAPLYGGLMAHQGEELKTLYLSHLEFDSSCTEKERVEILAALIDGIYSEKANKKYHTISYLDFEGHGLERAAKKAGGIYVTTPGTLYEVLHKKSLSETHTNEMKEFGFEISLA